MRPATPLLAALCPFRYTGPQKTEGHDHGK